MDLTVFMGLVVVCVCSVYFDRVTGLTIDSLMEKKLIINDFLEYLATH